LVSGQPAYLDEESREQADDDVDISLVPFDASLLLTPSDPDPEFCEVEPKNNLPNGELPEEVRLENDSRTVNVFRDQSSDERHGSNSSRLGIGFQLEDARGMMLGIDDVRYTTVREPVRTSPSLSSFRGLSK
jgi:hypothetical protein